MGAATTPNNMPRIDQESAVWNETITESPFALDTMHFPDRSQACGGAETSVVANGKSVADSATSLLQPRAGSRRITVSSIFLRSGSLSSSENEN